MLTGKNSVFLRGGRSGQDFGGVVGESGGKEKMAYLKKRAAREENCNNKE